MPSLSERKELFEAVSHLVDQRRANGVEWIEELDCECLTLLAKTIADLSHGRPAVIIPPIDNWLGLCAAIGVTVLLEESILKEELKS